MKKFRLPCLGPAIDLMMGRITLALGQAIHRIFIMGQAILLLVGLAALVYSFQILKILDLLG